MPERMHDELQREARQKIHTKTGPTGKKYPSVAAHRRAYVFGAMYERGWRPKVKHWGNEQ